MTFTAKELDVDTIVDYYCNKGWTIKKIAQSMHVSSPTIARSLKSVNITIRKRRVDVDINTITKLYCEDQLSISEIARRMNVSWNIIACRLTEHHVERHMNKIELDISELKRLYFQERWTLEKIAKQMNVAISTVSQRLREANVTMRKRTFDNKGSKNVYWKGHQEIGATEMCKIRSSAKSRNLYLDLTIEDLWDLYIKQKGRCYFSNIPIGFRDDPSSGKNSVTYYRSTASLDRLDSLQGYMISNCVWVHKIVQKMKNNIPEREFVKWCKLIANNYGNN
jgi:AraC-like DNA-binding protein